MYFMCRLFTVGLVFFMLTSSCLPVTDFSRGQPKRNSDGDEEAVILTPSATKDVVADHRRQVLEALFAHACVPQSNWGRRDKILVAWPADLPVAGELAIRIMTASSRIYLERLAFVEGGTVLRLGYAYQLPVGTYDIVIMPTPGEYHIGGLRISRKIAIQVNHRPERTLLADNQCQ